MSAADDPEGPDLPGIPPERLQAVYGALTPSQRAALRDALERGVSAESLARVLRRHGHQIGETTIKTYRRSLAADRSVTSG